MTVMMVMTVVIVAKLHRVIFRQHTSQLQRQQNGK